jgi:hypothetical protein
LLSVAIDEGFEALKKEKIVSVKSLERKNTGSDSMRTLGAESQKKN